ncbi:hypothetical protein Acr_00g0026260 [Actinidia rufa]|uniref:Uncharacterized protein n=1 Tax=Actinidia rufa TaxID=165716 RepID=A0A7J0DDL7_9ERIC|nr:hypothetical protein Acr_00g0026260 [Actinidia rufa]
MNNCCNQGFPFYAFASGPRGVPFSIEVSDLIKGVAAEHAWLKEEKEELSTSSSGLSSSDSFGLSDEEVDPGCRACTRLSSDSKAPEDLEFPVVASAVEDLIKHSFNQGGSLGSRSEEEVGMVPKFKVLGKKKVAGAELNHPASDPILALPSLAMEVQSSAPSSKTLDLATVKRVTILAHIEAEVAFEQLNKALQENTMLKKVAYREVFQKLETPLDHPAWNAVAPPIEPSDPPAVYSLLILPGFYEEEYMNQSINKEGVSAIEVGATLGNELVGGE